MIFVPIHVIAGLTALVAGAVALYAAKGAKLHRKSGMIFVYAMLVMAGSGALMAAILEPNRINVIAGLLACYLVSTGFLTVRRGVAGIRWLDLGAMLMALAIAIVSISFGFAASSGPGGELDEMPASGYFVFGIVPLLAALGDLRMILAQGIQGKGRIARHLWRMCLALFIAYGSFFWGQADEFPQEIRNTRLLSIPVLAVVLTSLYWVVRVSFTQWYQRVWQRVPRNAVAALGTAESAH